MRNGRPVPKAGLENTSRAKQLEGIRGHAALLNVSVNLKALGALSTL